MAGSTRQPERKKRILQTISRLLQEYPNATIALTNWKTPWELLVSVILSAQCTDVMVNKVTASLFVQYPTFDAYLSADPHVFEQRIRSTGFYKSKTKHILAAARVIHASFHDVVPHTMEELLTVPGVARKTANVVLGIAFQVVEGITVDTHVIRLSQRLGLVDIDTIGGKNFVFFDAHGTQVVEYKKDANPVKIETQLMTVLPRDVWFQVPYALINHGRAVCKAQKPNCEHCVLSDTCPSFRVEKFSS